MFSILIDFVRWVTIGVAAVLAIVVLVSFGIPQRSALIPPRSDASKPR